MKRLAAFFLLFWMTGYCYAFSPNAHMVIANIAYERLTPAVRAKIDQMVADFSTEYPQTNTFMLLSRWADDIKGQKINIYSHWHYINIPFSQDNTPLKEIADTDNILWALNNIMPTVQNSHCNRYERARFLAFFIHCLADLHQPLHTTARLSEQYPYGDEGGNLYYVKFPDAGHTVSMHKLWDNGFNYFATNSEPETIQKLTNEITQLYPEKYFGSEVYNFNFKDWQEEGYQLSVSFVYDTPENKVPSTAYSNKGKELVEQRVALAGYRIANLLNTLLT